MIYLDNAATTKMDESLLEVYRSFSCNLFFNASAGYKTALSNKKILEDARIKLRTYFGANSGDVVFTSGATEANNLAIKGSVKNGNWNYIFSIGEHPSVYNVAKILEQNGHDVRFVGLQKNGEIDYEQLDSLIDDRTRLVSAMLISNETGAINDIEKISKIIKKHNSKVLLHVDGVQGFCKIPVQLDKWGVDLFSISAHKFQGPKGVGALYVRNKSILLPQNIGGGQELGIRSGTENLPGIVSMMVEINKIDVRLNFERVKVLKDVFLNEIKNKGIRVFESKSPYICSISFKGVNGETLMRAIENEVIIGTGSACSTKKSGNRVLEAIGFDKEYIKQSVRVSFNPYQSVDEVKTAGKIILNAYKDLFERLK